MNNFDRDLTRFFNKIDLSIKQHLPNIVAETAVEHFKAAFVNKSWNGKPWKAYKNKKHEPSRGSLMMRSNALFGSIRPSSVSPTRVVMSAGNSRIPYARIHNEGGVIAHKARQTVVTHKVYKSGKQKGKTLFAKNNSKASYSQRATIGAYNQTMPQRQFMGKSQPLLNEIKTRFKNTFRTP